MKNNLLAFLFSALAFVACTDDSINGADTTTPPAGDNGTNPTPPAGGDGNGTVAVRDKYTYTPYSNPEEFVVIEDMTDEFENGIDETKWEKLNADFPCWDFKGSNVTHNGKGCVNLTIRHDPRTDRSYWFDGDGNKQKKAYYTYMDNIYFTSGALRSKAMSVYGYYEVKMKGTALRPSVPGKSSAQTKNMGACPSFWLYSDVNTGIKNVPAASNNHKVFYNEIDIIELNQSAFHPETLSQNLHIMTWEDGKQYFADAYKHPEIGLNETKNCGWDSAEDFHLYACENRPDSIIMYVDGKRTAAKPNLFWHLDDEVGGGMKVIIAIGLRNPYEKYVGGVRVEVPVTAAEAEAAGFPESSTIEYIRSWRRKDNYASFPSSEREWKGKAVEPGK